MSINRQSERDIARERAYAMQQSIGMNQTRDTGLAAVMTESQKKRHTAKLDESRQLKGHPSDYLTSLEPSGEHIEYWPMSFFKHQEVDLDRFKQECKGIDDEN